MTKLLSMELLEAAASGEVGAVTVALERGADLWAENLSGQHALALALTHQEEDLALVLLGRMTQARPDLTWLGNPTKSTGNNLVHQAIKGRCYRFMNALLKAAGEQRPVLLRQANRDGFTPLLMAVQQQADRYVTGLLKFDRSLIEDVQQGFSPLSLAVNEDKESLVDALLALGASLELPEAAPAWGRVQSMGMFDHLSRGLDMVACRTREKEGLLHVLTSRGTELKLPFFRAVFRQVISRNPMALQEVCVRGQTVLHRAVASRCSVAVVEFLVEEGAYWTPVDIDGRTPLDLAMPTPEKAAVFPYSEPMLSKWHSQHREQHLNQGLPLADPTAPRVRF